MKCISIEFTYLKYQEMALSWITPALILLLFLVCLFDAQKLLDNKTVKLTTGKLVGKQWAVDGTKAVIFKGIPYAEPPLGPLRFKVRVMDTVKDEQNTELF